MLSSFPHFCLLTFGFYSLPPFLRVHTFSFPSCKFNLTCLLSHFHQYLNMFTPLPLTKNKFLDLVSSNNCSFSSWFSQEDHLFPQILFLTVSFTLAHCFLASFHQIRSSKDTNDSHLTFLFLIFFHLLTSFDPVDSYFLCETPLPFDFCYILLCDSLFYVL